MKTYANRSKRPATHSQAQSARPSTVSAPNSAYLAATGSRGGGMEDLESRMMARMQSYRDAQITGAEREADAIASTINPSASIEEVKSTLGQKLGADFSKVSIHTGAGARDMADSIGADAYTSGTDVYLGEGASNAQTVAHELVHTVQQGGISGFGVTQSAAFGTVQMKPGKRARLKNWFKRKFHGKPTTETNDNGETVTDDGVEKIIEPGAMAGTNLFYNMNRTSELNKLQNYNHTDKTAKVRQMEAGDFDSHFDALETDEDRVNELQKLAQYLSAAREESKDGTLSEYDQALEQTYKSSLQKASGSDDFMKELMKQSVASSEAMRAIASQNEKNRKNMYQYSRSYTRKEMEADPSLVDKWWAEMDEESKIFNGHQYNTVVDSEEGRRFNALRFMMGDAANLMIDGDRRANWNELRRQRFDSQQYVDRERYEDIRAMGSEPIAARAETKGRKGFHPGQEMVRREDGTYDYTDVSRYVSEMYSGFNTFRRANSMHGYTDENKKRHKARNQAYMQNYQLPKRFKHLPD